jgi:hypothetical protein
MAGELGHLHVGSGRPATRWAVFDRSGSGAAGGRRRTRAPPLGSSRPTCNRSGPEPLPTSRSNRSMTWLSALRSPGVWSDRRRRDVDPSPYGERRDQGLGDALCLETLGASNAEWAPLLAAYDAERTPVGRSLVPWSSPRSRPGGGHTAVGEHDQPDFEAWIAGSLDGDRLYFYGSSDHDPAASRGTARP